MVVGLNGVKENVIQLRKDTVKYTLMPKEPE